VIFRNNFRKAFFRFRRIDQEELDLARSWRRRKQAVDEPEAKVRRALISPPAVTMSP
jgi:hypothetical protein